MKHKTHKCDFPGCVSKEAWRCDVPTNWFRGDDVVMLLCKDHRKKEYYPEVLKTEKAQKQY